MMIDFPKADPVERGCGEREQGGVYAETGLSRYGTPLEYFLIDPPQPLPVGLDLINKPQLWEDPATGITHLLIWVGSEHYEWCSDYIEETRRFGASRRINPNLELTRLTRESRMILAHPRAINTLWEVQHPPQECQKQLPRHDIVSLALLNNELIQKEGPCLFKVWEIIPQDTATEVMGLEGERPICLRKVGSTVYQYRPTGESAEGLQPGLFAALPITGFALIQYDDGTVNEGAKAKLQQACLNFYETDR
jgi:hypothetical protein